MAFCKLGMTKPLVVLELLERHHLSTVIFCDVDTIWLRHPGEFLAHHPTADMFIATECLSHWVKTAHTPDSPSLRPATNCDHIPGREMKTGPEHPWGGAYNAGVIIFRNRCAAPSNGIT